MKRILIAILTALTLLAGWTPAAHAADRRGWGLRGEALLLLLLLHRCKKREEDD